MVTDKKINGPIKAGWVPMEGGYEATQNPEIIAATIKWLKESRTIISLLSKGYQSGGTILYNYTANHIFIDKPKDWPDKKMRLRVVFRNEAKIWMHFVTTIQAQSKDGLLCAPPVELFMLQRRSHYRVILPQGSVATFAHDKQQIQIPCKDLSAGGMLLVSRDGTDMIDVTHISDISLTIPTDDIVPDVVDGILTLKIKEADIIRETIQQSPVMLFCYGARFYCPSNEEEKILRYVRQRELEILRKGVNE